MPEEKRNIYRVETYISSDEKSIEVFYPVDNPSLIKYTVQVPIPTQHGWTTAAKEITDVKSIEEAFDKIDTIMNEHKQQLKILMNSAQNEPKLVVP